MYHAIRFCAVDAEIDPSVRFVGFSGEQHYFWMQPDEMTTNKERIWLERNDQRYGGCGGTRNIVLTRTTFIVHTQDAPWLSCDRVEVDFAVDEIFYGRLMDVLKQAMVSCLGDLDIRDT